MFYRSSRLLAVDDLTLDSRTILTSGNEKDYCINNLVNDYEVQR